MTDYDEDPNEVHDQVLVEMVFTRITGRLADSSETRRTRGFGTTGPGPLCR